MGLMVVLIRDYRYKKKNYIDDKLNILESRVEATVQNLTSFSRFVFEDMIDHDEITGIMAEAWKADEIHRAGLRNQLYNKMLSKYKALCRFNFRQLHFHFPDCTSFLRMHSPKDFGDNLSSVRTTVRLTNTNLQTTIGFEEGRIFNGYRFVYPIFHRNEHCGSVEVSFSMEFFLGILNNLTHYNYYFIIQRSVVESTVFSHQQHNYSVCSFSDNYLFDNNISNDDSKIQIIQNKSRNTDQLLASGKSFGFYTRFQDKYYLLLFKAMPNLENNVVAYIISIAEDQSGHVLDHDFIVLMALLIFAGAGFIVFVNIILSNQKKLEHLSNIDPLSQLNNRRSFIARVDQEFARSKRYSFPLSLALIDIDNFKLINDTYGHNEGDRVIREISTSIAKNIRISDQAGRWGGEEFVILFTHINLDSAFRAIEKIRAEVAANSIIPNHSVTISIGLAHYELNDTIDKLMNKADIALYEAKHSGKNCIRIFSDTTTSHS